MMSSVYKNILIDGKTYKIMKAFDPEQVQQYGIQMIEGIYKKTFNIPMYYGKALKDAYYRKNLMEIEQEHVSVIISPNSVEDSTISISSDEEIKVGRSIFHLHRLLSTIRDGISARQFLAVPVLNGEIQENFLKFQKEVLKLNSQAVEESIFQKTTKLHLSINVFSLVDKQEVEAAKQALMDCKAEVILPLITNKLPLKLDIRGIDCMQTNHSKVHVVYAKAKILNENEDFNLQMLLDRIKEYFYQRGLTKDCRDEHVKIHMTLINTKYRGSKSLKRRTSRIPINATDILTQFKDFYFGQSDLNCINLCLISSSEAGGYYKKLAEINM